MPELLLCADDFGLHAGVDRAIAELVGLGRIGALSCLTNLPRWREAVAGAMALRSRAMVGLHLNLTEGVPVSATLARRWQRLPGLAKLIGAAHLRLLPRAAIAAEVDAQWLAFEHAAGRPPDFVDGHQHVHHLPGVREAVVERVARAGVALRSTAHVAGPGDAFKRAVIERTGGRMLARLARRRGIACNAVLLGAYGFEGDYRERMQGWLARVPAGGALLFCHPGHRADPHDTGSFPDPIAAARGREYAYLAGDAFAEDLAAAGVTLSRRWPVAE